MMLPRFAARKVQKMNTAVHRLPWNAASSFAGLPPRRYALVLLIAGIYCAVSGATRVVLALKALAASQIAVSELTNILLIGTGYDIVASLYLCAPLILYLLLLPERIFHGRAHRVAAWGLFALVVYGLTYLGAVEYFFFDEFNSRFNFVAVEYLIYPHEVFVNIWESYPVGKVLFASVIVTALLLWLLQPRIAGALAARSRISQRLASAGWLLAALAAVHIGLDINSGHAGQNRVARSRGSSRSRRPRRPRRCACCCERPAHAAGQECESERAGRRAPAAPRRCA
jgi:phosphoglycerol transferase MdoB-like AlkP superfamily enzyme